MNKEYQINNFDNDPYFNSDQYNDSNTSMSTSDSFITFLQVFLGLLSFSGCVQVFYVNCKYCFTECLKKKKIKKRKIKEEELLSECIICLEDYKINDNVSTLICNHVYHTKCLDEWLKKKNECPLCRIEI